MSSHTTHTKCNFLESSIFNNIHCTNLIHCAESSWFPPFFIHFFASFCLTPHFFRHKSPSQSLYVCVCVILLQQSRTEKQAIEGGKWDTVGSVPQSNLNVFSLKLEIIHLTPMQPSTHTPSLTHRNNCVMPAVLYTHMMKCTFAHTPTQTWKELDFIPVHPLQIHTHTLTNITYCIYFRYMTCCYPLLCFNHTL